MKFLEAEALCRLGGRLGDAIALLKMLYEENKEDGKIIEYARENWDMVSKNVTQNIARLRLKRYLSVMANTKVRKKYFGF